jgi:hypothetical protein
VDRVLLTNDPAFRPTEIPGDDVDPPDPIESFVAVGAPGVASLAWIVPDDPDVTRVVVRYRTDGNAPRTPADGLPAIDGEAVPGETVAVDLSAVEPGIHYTYSAFAVDAAGNASDPVSAAATPLGQPPGQVHNLRRTDTPE